MHVLVFIVFYCILFMYMNVPRCNVSGVLALLLLNKINKVKARRSWTLSKTCLFYSITVHCNDGLWNSWL